ncbi:dihydromonapterin reductase [Marinomonas sp. M1K-6]|uniref:Dihydromonapterin reductase n=1 Tax=Marinomonas profundi TaxID=2726122 RepID=A0A847R014_9GAMM|nr:dihydromonapterin reductase [Marinomonas profundi]NLQ16662.1 dihydromonapterin reductase [Marinomonas profundi]UDV03760.1 dihydromonapterin reductase [Marinomonas profundi]
MTGKMPIIITGGAQRLGLACAQALAAQDYDVLVTYRTSRDSIADLESQGIRCIQADFSTLAGVDAFIAKIQQDYQALRGIIHNASEWESEEHCEDTALLMEKMWQVHVFAPYRINLAFEALLCAKSQQGEMTDIIHMTDYVVEKGSDKHIAYASSKAGLANLTHSFAKRFAPNIKVNAIAPSLLMFHDDDDAEYRQKALHKSLLSREPGEQEGVLAVQYILDSHYMTGRTLSLDGGRHLV